MSILSSADLDNRFDFHPPLNDSTKARHEDIREAARRFTEIILSRTVPGREQSTAITKIEEAMFWGNASIARHP